MPAAKSFVFRKTTGGGRGEKQRDQAMEGHGLAAPNGPGNCVSPAGLQQLRPLRTAGSRRNHLGGDAAGLPRLGAPGNRPEWLVLVCLF